MAEQLQLRRGIEQAQDLFTGAEGEVTMATDTKELRVHDGMKVGGFRVPTLVAVQYPSSANNYTWYRKYSDGWVEMGGKISYAGDTLGAGQTGVVVNGLIFPVALSTVASVSFGNTMMFWNCHAANLTTTGMDVKVSSQLAVSYTQAAATITWEVKGMAA